MRVYSHTLSPFAVVTKEDPYYASNLRSNKMKRKLSRNTMYNKVKFEYLSFSN